MLQLGQGLRLIAFQGRYFEDYGPTGQVFLFRHEDAGERPAAQRVPHAETKQLVADGRQRQPRLALARPGERLQDVMGAH